jgi:hypothetical protein
MSYRANDVIGIESKRRITQVASDEAAVTRERSIRGGPRRYLSLAFEFND